VKVVAKEDHFMIIYGSLVDTGTYISVDKFLGYLSDMFIDARAYKCGPLAGAGKDRKINWAFKFYNCEFVASKAHLIGQAFWLAYRKFCNPLYAVEPQSVAGIVIELRQLNGEPRHLRLDRKCRAKEEFLNNIVPELRKITMEESLKLSVYELAVKKTNDRQLAYAPPFSPVWDPVASEVAKKL
jgi:hypothetical protein